MKLGSSDIETELEQAERDLAVHHRRVVELRKAAGALKIVDHTLNDADGRSVALSSLFGDKDDLIIIHNMGRSCRYCTLWADGLNGLRMHIENRAALALVSPDEPSVMKEFAHSRGWTFRLLSDHGGTFTKNVGFVQDGKFWPGVSTFHRGEDGSIRRIGRAYFGPSDDFCALWHIFDLLPEGANGWEPQYTYNTPAK